MVLPNFELQEKIEPCRHFWKIPIKLFKPINKYPYLYILTDPAKSDEKSVFSTGGNNKSGLSSEDKDSSATETNDEKPSGSSGSSEHSKSGESTGKAGKKFPLKGRKPLSSTAGNQKKQGSDNKIEEKKSGKTD